MSGSGYGISCIIFTVLPLPPTHTHVVLIRPADVRGVSAGRIFHPSPASELRVWWRQSQEAIFPMAVVPEDDIGLPPPHHWPSAAQSHWPRIRSLAAWRHVSCACSHSSDGPAGLTLSPKPVQSNPRNVPAAHLPIQFNPIRSTHVQDFKRAVDPSSTAAQLRLNNGRAFALTAVTKCVR
jgi:hypothetical protein